MTRFQDWFERLFMVAAITFALYVAHQTAQPIEAQQGSSSLPSYPIAVHDTGTSATVVKAFPGTLHTLTINTAGASAVITVYDIAGSACTGTPSGAVISITLPASGVLPGSLLYDKQFANGICLLDATANSDITAVAF